MKTYEFQQISVASLGEYNAIVVALGTNGKVYSKKLNSGYTDDGSGIQQNDWSLLEDGE